MANHHDPDARALRRVITIRDSYEDGLLDDVDVRALTGMTVPALNRYIFFNDPTCQVADFR